MEFREPFEAGECYHVYNHAVGSDNIFRCDENYNFFLNKYQEYLSDTWDTLAWCLMPNHFHLLVRIKGPPEQISSDALTKKISAQYSHFTNSYAQAYNKYWNRRGALFMHRFKRKRITDEIYLKQAICYIHKNPVNHGFRNSPDEWEFSSYNEILQHTHLPENKEIIRLFENRKNFILSHSSSVDIEL